MVTLNAQDMEREILIAQETGKKTQSPLAMMMVMVTEKGVMLYGSDLHGSSTINVVNCHVAHQFLLPFGGQWAGC